MIQNDGKQGGFPTCFWQNTRLQEWIPFCAASLTHLVLRHYTDEGSYLNSYALVYFMLNCKPYYLQNIKINGKS